MNGRLLVAVLLLLSACSPQGNLAPPDRTDTTAPPADTSRLVTAREGADLLLVGPGMAAGDARVPVVSVEIAATRAARERGLGGRETLPDGRGMLFVYTASRGRGFWMKDCLIGLDILFLDVDGEIRDIATLPPGAGLAGDDIPAHDCPSPIRYVLEVRARWCEERGIAVGDIVDVRHVTEGVVAEE